MAKNKTPGLFEEFEPPTEPPRQEPRRPFQNRHRALLLEDAAVLRAAADRPGESVYAAVACGVWSLDRDEVDRVAKLMAELMEA